jgi:hypothetical protein
MNINDKPFFRIQPLLLCNEVNDFKAEIMIKNAPQDIGELSVEKFIKGTNFANYYYSAELISNFSCIALKKLYICKSYLILKTAKVYIEQMEKFLTKIKDIGERFKLPDKASVSLQDDYSWVSLIDVLAKGDVSKHEAVKRMPLYDFVLMLKKELDTNYSTYLKMKAQNIN